jgi:hypothetical protein
MVTEPPSDPIAAVTHRDPYPYCGELVALRPIARDERLGLWIACSAGAVADVLASDLCRVRPLAEPLPKALLGSTAGLIFEHLVRMNDGAKHAWRSSSCSPCRAGSRISRSAADQASQRAETDRRVERGDGRGTGGRRPSSAERLGAARRQLVAGMSGTDKGTQSAPHADAGSGGGPCRCRTALVGRTRTREPAAPNSTVATPSMIKL